jgi:hypothetical protein
MRCAMFFILWRRRRRRRLGTVLVGKGKRFHCFQRGEINLEPNTCSKKKLLFFCFLKGSEANIC